MTVTSDPLDTLLREIEERARAVRDPALSLCCIEDLTAFIEAARTDVPRLCIALRVALTGLRHVNQYEVENTDAQLAAVAAALRGEE